MTSWFFGTIVSHHWESQKSSPGTVPYTSAGLTSRIHDSCNGDFCAVNPGHPYGIGLGALLNPIGSPSPVSSPKIPATGHRPYVSRIILFNFSIFFVRLYSTENCLLFSVIVTITMTYLIICIRIPYYFNFILYVLIFYFLLFFYIWLVVVYLNFLQ